MCQADPQDLLPFSDRSEAVQLTMSSNRTTLVFVVLDQVLIAV